MAYVPDAGSDIFISYPMEAKEWAVHFEQDLAKELEQWLPASELRIYLGERDWQLAPAHEMLEEARQAAFFVVTLVPGALVDDGVRFFQQDRSASPPVCSAPWRRGLLPCCSSRSTEGA
jgi:hypothetical protein